VAADEVEDRAGQSRPADDQVGQGHVVLVVGQLRAVDARAEQPGRAGDGDRRGVVPLVLPARVDVGVGDVAHHRHHLDPGRAHRHQLGVELLGQRLDERRRAAARDRDPRHRRGRRRHHGRHTRVEGLPQRGLGDGTGDELAVLPQRHVHGPVVARGLGELPGAVQGVDDPHPVRIEPGLVVGALLREHRVAGPVLGEQPHQQVVRGAVAGVLEGAALQSLGADLEQALAGDRGQPGGEGVVVAGGRGGRGSGIESHPVTLLRP